MTDGPWPRRACLLLLFVATTVVMWRPTRLGTDIFGNVGDPAFTTWVMLWDLRALVTDPLGVFDAPIFHPYGSTLAYSENLFALAPVFGLLEWITGNPVLAMNLLVLGLSVFCQAATYALVRRLVGRGDVAVIAAFAFSFSSFVFMHAGHVQLLTLGMFPLTFLLLFRLLERPGYGRAVGFGLASAALFSGALYYGAIFAVTAGTIVALHLAALRFRPPSGTYPTLAVAGLVGAVLILPMALPYRDVEDVVGTRFPANVWSLNATDLITPAPTTVVHDALAEASEDQPERHEHTLFQGVITIVLGVIGAVASVMAWWRRRRSRPVATEGREDEVTAADDEVRWGELGRLVAAGAVAAVLALGLSVRGVQAPYHYFYEYVPGFSGIRVTARLAVPAMLAGAALAAVGLRVILLRVGRRFALPVVVVVGVVLLAELFVDPVDRQRLELDSQVTAVYDELDDRPTGAVLELPVVDVSTAPGAEWAFIEAPRLIYSTHDWNERFNGYSGYWPPDYIANAQVLNGFPSPESLALARQLGLRYVLLHTGSSHGVPMLTEAEADAIVADLPAGATADRYGRSWLVDLGAAA